MDKPVSLSVKAWIIRQMSVRMFIQESIIETVVNHQFEAAYVALDKCGSLEFSGFGRFYFNRKKALKKFEKVKNQIREFTRIVEDPLTTETRRKQVEYKLKITLKIFEYLKMKLDNEGG